MSCDETLVSHTYQLVGRPDYIVRTDAGPVPVEVKSRSCGAHGPYEAEKAQLFAYCLLVEDAWGTSVKSGIIKFRDRKWNVPFGDRERRWVIGTLGQIANDGDVAFCAIEDATFLWEYWDRRMSQGLPR